MLYAGNRGTVTVQNQRRRTLRVRASSVGCVRRWLGDDWSVREPVLVPHRYVSSFTHGIYTYITYPQKYVSRTIETGGVYPCGSRITAVGKNSASEPADGALSDAALAGWCWSTLKSARASVHYHKVDRCLRRPSDLYIRTRSITCN